jgi:hypothetical protein
MAFLSDSLILLLFLKVKIQDYLHQYIFRDHHVRTVKLNGSEDYCFRR